MRGRRDQHWRRRGFTLIELLVVLAILGLLVSVATPQVLKYLANAKIETARIQIRSMSTALDLFFADTGRYPTTEEGLKALVSAPHGLERWAGPYVKKNDTLNDPWGRPFVYMSPGEHGPFDLSSNGPEARGARDGAAPAMRNW